MDRLDATHARLLDELDTLRRENASLRESEQRYRSVFRNELIAICLFDSETFRILDANDTHVRLYGYSREELLNDLSATDLTAECHLSLESLPDILSSRATVIPRRYHKKKDGTIFPVEVFAGSYSLDGRNIVLTMVTDITERGRSEEALLESRATLGLVLDTVPQSIFWKDLESRYLGCNRVFATAVGLEEPALIVGKTDFDLPWPREDAEAYRADDREVLEENAPKLHILEQLQQADGTRLWIDTSKAPLRNAEGRPMGVLGIYDDVTARKGAEEALRGARDELEARVRERTTQLEAAKRTLESDIERREKAESEKKELEAQLRQSQVLEAIGRLAGGVAHDFNNLLASVLSCAWIARLPGAATGDIHRELARIQELCRQGGEVTRQLLAFARQTPRPATPLDLKPSMKQLRLLVERACPKTVSVVFDVGASLPRVQGDRGLLTTALLNVCLNARDAMPGGGTLTVRARRRRRAGKNWAVIEVSDTGEGIPREIGERIFQPFFSTKPVGRGSGLGLSTALATANGMGGALELASEPGRGSTFTFRLPASSVPSDASVSAREAENGLEFLGATGEKVLIVEDEEDIARFAEEVFARRGYKVLRASRGLEALETLRANEEGLALVLLDLVLPELSASTLYRALAAGAPHIPILFMTGREDLAAEVDPAIPLLRKPFSESELLECARRAVLGGV